jgi:hypothetical protein
MPSTPSEYGMFAPPARLALALCLVLSAAGMAQGSPAQRPVPGDRFEYAAGTSQYRITSKTKAAQEMMGQKQEFESSNNQLLTVTVARASRDTLSVLLVLDSITAMGPMGPPPGIDKLRGAKVVAKLAPFGGVYSAVGPTDDSIPNGTQVTDEMSRFLPKIRGKLAAGTSWTDTTAGKAKQGGIDVDRKVIATFTVIGDTTVSAEKSWKIARATNTTLSGSGTSQGQPMTMEGTSNGKGTLVVSQKGVFVGGENEENAIIKIVLTANGMEVGVTTTANTKIEKVK